jgi:hypothetical protein
LGRFFCPLAFAVIDDWTILGEIGALMYREGLQGRRA